LGAQTARISAAPSVVLHEQNAEWCKQTLSTQIAYHGYERDDARDSLPAFFGTKELAEVYASEGGRVEAFRVSLDNPLVLDVWQNLQTIEPRRRTSLQIAQKPRALAQDARLGRRVLRCTPRDRLGAHNSASAKP
jgi:hypothetical protein